MGTHKIRLKGEVGLAIDDAVVTGKLAVDVTLLVDFSEAMRRGALALQEDDRVRLGLQIPASLHIGSDVLLAALAEDLVPQP